MKNSLSKKEKLVNNAPCYRINIFGRVQRLKMTFPQMLRFLKACAELEKLGVSVKEECR